MIEETQNAREEEIFYIFRIKTAFEVVLAWESQPKIKKNMNSILLIALSTITLLGLVYYIKKKRTKNRLLNDSNFIPNYTYRYELPWEDIIGCF